MYQVNIAELADEDLHRCGEYDALVEGGRVWSNRALHEQAQRLASGLIASGVAPGDRVVLALHSGRAALVASEAVWRCGAVVVYVNPTAPATELAQIAAHCSPAATVATDALAPWDPASQRRIAIYTARDGELDLDDVIARHAPLAAAIPRAAGDPAQLVYTSGTTGRLKAVVYHHGGLAAILAHHANATAPIVALVALPPTAFAGHLLLSRWSSQAKLVVFERFDPHEVLAAIAEHGVTRLPIVPSMGEALVAVARERAADSSLCEVFVSGAHSSPALVDALARTFGVRPAIAYGMTEVGGSISWTTETAKPGSVGTVVPGVELTVVDAADQPLPRGEVGEIRVKSPWMASGYWEDPAETAAVFRNGWVYTGDLGRHDVSGELYLVGRGKEIIIQAGFNVSPRDVADVVTDAPGVAQCAVIGIPHDVLGEEVVVCVVRLPGSPVTAQDLHAHCRARLDAKKLPGRIVFLDALPMTSGGKVKLAELREVVAGELARTRDVAWIDRLRVASPAERVAITRDEIVRLVQEARGNAAVDPDATFPQLGLTSMDRVQVIHALSSLFGQPLRATLAYRHPSPTALAEALVGKLDLAAAPGLDLRPTTATSCRATPSQNYFWCLALDDPDASAYYTPAAMLVEGPLDQPALERSLTALIDGHSVFRTTFREAEGGLMQVVADTRVAPALEVTDRSELGSVAPEVWDREIASAVEELLANGFDLAHGRLLWSRLIRLAPERHALVLVIHHITTDAQSLALFTRRLFELYAGERAGTPAHERPPLQFIDFADALVRWATTPGGRVQAAAWRQRLHGAPAVEVPVDLPRAAVDLRRDRARLGVTADPMHPPKYVQLAADVRASASRVAHEAGVTTYAVYLAGLVWLLHRETGQTDICVESTASMRPAHAALQTMQGLLVTWTIMRIDFATGSTFRDVVQRTAHVVAESQENGFIENYYQLVPHTLRRVTFNYVPLPRDRRTPEDHHDKLRIVHRPQPFARWKRSWDLHLTMLESPHDALLVWTGNEKLFRTETLSALLERYLGIFTGEAAGDRSRS